MPKKDRDAVSEGLSDIFGSGTTDLLSSVIQSDRRRAGRSPESIPSPSSPPKHLHMTQFFSKVTLL